MEGFRGCFSRAAIINRYGDVIAFVLLVIACFLFWMAAVNERNRASEFKSGKWAYEKNLETAKEIILRKAK